MEKEKENENEKQINLSSFLRGFVISRSLMRHDMTCHALALEHASVVALIISLFICHLSEIR
jgi:hypothetical protein